MCNCNKNSQKPSFNIPKTNEPKNLNIPVAPIKNLKTAAVAQTSTLKWFFDGVSKLVKCYTGEKNYSDDIIRLNREVCKGCEFSTKNKDNLLTNLSQCMAPDPKKNNAPCGCFIICKSQVGECPAGKWTHLTLNNKKLSNEKLYQDDSKEIPI